MKPADDPEKDYKALVESGYDMCAAAYDEARREEKEQALAMLIDLLEDGATALDVGCGGGVPVARDLAQRFAVTGVDISSKMIACARTNIPSGTFIHGDIMSINFPPAHFDAVVAFYSVFHLPREEHRKLFSRIYEWLKPGGYLLATVGMGNEPAYTEDDFFGTTMYWSNYGLEEYEEILSSLGYNILETAMVGHGYDESHERPDEHHPLIFAQKNTE